MRVTFRHSYIRVLVLVHQSHKYGNTVMNGSSVPAMCISNLTIQSENNTSLQISR